MTTSNGKSGWQWIARAREHGKWTCSTSDRCNYIHMKNLLHLIVFQFFLSGFFSLFDSISFVVSLLCLSILMQNPSSYLQQLYFRYTLIFCECNKTRKKNCKKNMNEQQINRGQIIRTGSMLVCHNVTDSIGYLYVSPWQKTHKIIQSNNA